MPLTHTDIQAMNAHFHLVVARAALEDLRSVRLAHGVDSQAYQCQLGRSLGFIRGSLEAVLTAALPALQCRVEGVHGGCSHPTQID
jgi:hypothetical protein